MPQKLHSIYIYPVKSLHGIALGTTNLTPRGLEHDRKWMLVDDTGRFISLRESPEMYDIKLDLETKGIRFRHKHLSLDSFFLPFNCSSTKRVPVQVWDDFFEAIEVGDTANEWFSTALDRSCRLVYMGDDCHRQIDLKYADEGEYVSFADGYPILIIGKSSLDDLNTRLENPIEMLRFRPNLVFEGGVAFEEDNWNSVTIGNTQLRVVKPCARCSVPTMDLETGEKSKEPTKTLATYRREGNKIMFGVNAMYVSGEKVTIGDKIELGS